MKISSHRKFLIGMHARERVVKFKGDSGERYRGQLQGKCFNTFISFVC